MSKYKTDYSTPHTTAVKSSVMAALPSYIHANLGVLNPLKVENEPEWRNSLRDSKRREYSASPSRSVSIKSIRSRESRSSKAVSASPKKSMAGSPTVKSYLQADVPETVLE